MVSGNPIVRTQSQASAYLAEDKIASFSVELLSEPEIVKKIAQCKSEMQKVLRYLHKTWIQTFPSKIETYKTDRHVSKQPIVASGGILSGLVKFNVIPKLWLAVLRFLKQQKKIVENHMKPIRLEKPASKQTRKRRMLNEPIQTLIDSLTLSNCEIKNYWYTMADLCKIM